MMKLILLTLLLTLSKAAADCCATDNDSPNISERTPVAWSVFPANQVITFKAYMDDFCGISKLYINLYGYAMGGYTNTETPPSLCPPGYFCADYSFPTSGQNWWNIEAVDMCGNTRIVGNSTFCIESCPRNLRGARDTFHHKEIFELM